MRHWRDQAGPAMGAVSGRLRRGANGQRGFRRPRRARVRYAGLWLVLLVLSAVVVLAEGLVVARPSPPLAVAVATLSGAVGLALLYLGGARFHRSGRPPDLLTGAAFGTLALGNLVVRVLAPALEAGLADAAAGLWLLLLTRALAAGLFLGGLAWGGVVAPGARRRVTTGLGLGLAAGLVLGTVAVVSAGERLPPGLDERARGLLAADAVIVDTLPGQEPWLLLANGLTGLAMVTATIGYSGRALRARDPYLHALATGLTLLAFGQLHTLLFPPAALDYVSTAAALRLAAYIVLLVSLVGRVGRDIAEEATGDERLRVSRELHDGLLQQLALVSLRLARATAARRTPESRAEDLAVARRVLEAATIEARQAVVALRSGTVSWDEFRYALAGFADEFGRNHELAVDVTVHGTAGPLAAALQAEVLRMLHEASSNAVRHGAATRIDIDAAVVHARLHLQVRDDGRGFDPTAVVGNTGVGLQSMRERAARLGGDVAVEAAPNRGTTVRAILPLAGRREQHDRD